MTEQVKNELVKLVPEKIEEIADKHIENYKQISEIRHRHFLETTDRFSDYGQTCAREARTTITLLHGNCMELADKVSDTIKENRSLILPLARTAIIPVVVGILGSTVVAIEHTRGYKKKIETRDGKIKITDR